MFLNSQVPSTTNSVQSSSLSSDNGKNVIRRRRRPNFSFEELQALVKAVENRSHLVEGKIYGNFQSHRQAWLDVADEVNRTTGGYFVGGDVVGGGENGSVIKSTTIARTATELRLKWIDLTCRVRQKWRARLDGHNIKDYPSLQMSPLEYSVLAILRKTGGNRFKTSNSSTNRGRPPINPRFLTKSSVWSTNIIQANLNGSSSSNQARGQESAPVKVNTVVRVNGSNSRSSSSHAAMPSQIVQRRIAGTEITIAPVPPPMQDNTQIQKKIITIPDDLPKKVKSSRCSAPTATILPAELAGSSGSSSSNLNVEACWRELATRQEQTTELLRQILEENVKRRAVEEETLNMLKTIVSLQARSVELKELKLGFNHHEEEGYLINEDGNPETDICTEMELNNE